MENLEQSFTRFEDLSTLLEIAGLVFLLAIVSETIWDFVVGTRKKGWETLANFAIALGNTLLERTAYGLVFVVGLFVAAGFAPFSIPVTWWSTLLAILAADFMYYWMHRWEHEVRILWSYHSVHHSSPEFNLTTALRLAWVEGLIEWIFFVPIVLIGFDPAQTIIALAVVVTYQTWIHTQKIGKLGWLDRIFNTPSVHRVHHGSNDGYLDKNYGGILIIWDRMFGTYQAETETVVYGIRTPLETANPIAINFRELLNILRDARQARSPRDAFGYIFGPPGWAPEAKDSTSPDTEKQASGER